jgi:hypothetical protein
LKNVSARAGYLYPYNLRKASFIAQAGPVFIQVTDKRFMPVSAGQLLINTEARGMCRSFLDRPFSTAFSMMCQASSRRNGSYALPHRSQIRGIDSIENCLRMRTGGDAESAGFRDSAGARTFP